MTPKVSVILAAGGSGTRFAAGEAAAGKTLPKQFLELHGYPIFVWSLQVLLSSPAVANAIMVSPPHLVAEINRQLAQFSGRLGEKPIEIIPGGSTRQESVYLGLLALEEKKPDYVLIHDAARPFVTGQIVDRMVEAVIKYGACTTGIKPADTIKRVVENRVTETLDREELILVQTPQGGRFDWLLDAHTQAVREGIATTDDAAILESAGHEVSIVDGANFNIKITRPDDLMLAEALASMLFTDRL